ncbi:MAG: hypothetical protein NUW21_10020 [Elusimicrobia bacterium]|nr:hypothetical protein [Elusimicrobiota bacterium]
MARLDLGPQSLDLGQRPVALIRKADGARHGVVGALLEDVSRDTRESRDFIRVLLGVAAVDAGRLARHRAQPLDLGKRHVALVRKADGLGSSVEQCTYLIYGFSRDSAI